MKKKILALVLIVALVASLAIALTACEPTGDKNTLIFGPEDADITFGLICLHDENSTYDKNFIDAARVVAESQQVRVIVKTNVPEDATCYEAAADLADQGCDIVFADSFGHEDHVIRAAKEFSNVQFAHATGTKAHTENVANYHNAFASIYEGRYLAGIVAGYKLAEMYGNGDGSAVSAENAKIGYVGAYPYAEVVSGYTSFFLGVRSIVPNATMTVRYTNSWYDAEAEENTARKLITDDGCKLISQHADSNGAPNACEDLEVPNVTYNIAFSQNDYYLVGSRINWAPYYVYMMECVRDGKAIDTDWTGTLATGSVELLAYGQDVSQEVKDAVQTALEGLENGTIKVFDCSTFTVDGESLTSYLADVDTDADSVHETEVIVRDGDVYYFNESVERSAPYFDIIIDGITLI